MFLSVLVCLVLALLAADLTRPRARNEAPAGASQLDYQVRDCGASKNRTCDLILIRDAL